jgi:phosphoribosylaminoimidazole (AIR) synthetase
MEHVFNLGIGMLAIVAGSDARPALDAVRSAGTEAWLVGGVVEGHGRAIIERG